MRSILVDSSLPGVEHYPHSALSTQDWPQPITHTEGIRAATRILDPHPLKVRSLTALVSPRPPQGRNIWSARELPKRVGSSQSSDCPILMMVVRNIGVDINLSNTVIFRPRSPLLGITWLGPGTTRAVITFNVRCW